MNRVTTQQTSKKYKGQLVLSRLLMFVGAISMAATWGGPSFPYTAGLTAFAALWWFAAKFMAWWEHG